MASVAAGRKASLGQAGWVWVSFQEKCAWFREAGLLRRVREMAAPGPWGVGEVRSHRHAGLRQQLQCAGQADVRGHGQQPARIVPVMGPLQEQHRFFISPKRGTVSIHRLHLGHLLVPALQRKFSRSASAQAQSEESAERTWSSSGLLRPRLQPAGEQPRQGRALEAKTVDRVQLNPKGLCVDLVRNLCSKRL